MKRTIQDIPNQRTLLVLSWSTSRGRETYGWPICRLDALVPAADGYGFVRKRYRTMAFGNLIGKVLADWLSDQFQDRVASLPVNTPGVYQLPDRVIISGAFGQQSVIDRAASVGVEIEPQCNTRGNLTHFLVRVNPERSRRP